MPDILTNICASIVSVLTIGREFGCSELKARDLFYFSQGVMNICPDYCKTKKPFDDYAIERSCEMCLFVLPYLKHAILTEVR